ncbi:hypothetical protein [Raoultella planticola]|uniref:hypothetical protein n=1 Tax=Raoultella planticola TaxID=575 RepID=UPI003825EE20
MKLQLTAKVFRVLISSTLCKLLFWVNTAIATTFTAPGQSISVAQPSGSWVLAHKWTLFGAPPGYDGIRSLCSGLGNDGHGYAGCATGEKAHSGNYGGSIEGSVMKYTGTINGPNNSTMEVGIGLENMGLYFAGQKYNTGYADARATIIPLSSDFSKPEGTGKFSKLDWESGSWGLKHNNGCNVFNQCNRTQGIAALVPYHSSYGSQAVGSISLYIRVPNNISAGKYSGTVNLGYVNVSMDMGHNGSASYTASIYGAFEVYIPQRCNITFPGSVSFDTINGGTQSTTPLQTKTVTFTSECTGLAQTTVKAELLLESDAFDTAIGAVMLDTDKTLGVKASLNSAINCSSTSNELFNKQFLLVEHPQSTGTSTLSKNIYIALCKYGLITKPGDYSKSINAKVIYSTP